MATFEFVVESVLEEVVQVDAETLDDAEEIMLEGGGEMVGVPHQTWTVLASREIT